MLRRAYGCAHCQLMWAVVRAADAVYCKHSLGTCAGLCWYMLIRFPQAMGIWPQASF